MGEETKVSGEVEIDGAYFGGYVKPANHRENRRDLRLGYNRSGKREVVVVMRERKGKTMTVVTKSEDAAIADIKKSVAIGSTVYADESRSWNPLHETYLTKRINHSMAYSTADACTNQAESYFSRLRRAEIGTHHRISGRYLGAYASEMAWREDNRRISNGEQYLKVVAAANYVPVWGLYGAIIAFALVYSKKLFSL